MATSSFTNRQRTVKLFAVVLLGLAVLLGSSSVTLARQKQRPGCDTKRDVYGCSQCDLLSAEAGQCLDKNLTATTLYFVVACTGGKKYCCTSRISDGTLVGCTEITRTSVPDTSAALPGDQLKLAPVVRGVEGEPPLHPGPLAPHQLEQVRQVQQLSRLSVEPEAPVTAPTVQEKQATPAESGEVQTRSAKRGRANTATRAEWCSDHLLACYSAGDEYCRQHYADAASLKICNDSVTDSCGRSWGWQSTCMTDVRISVLDTSVLDTGVIQQPGVVVEPVAPVPNPTLPKFDQKGVLRRGVEGEQPASAPK